mmetsp:Transcript_104984/g.338546  ORF Transcript_104984/g.338546 Transcript_104984/m.338546 type:complete len:202 (-) Transcript_104984:942-1547(-)
MHQLLQPFIKTHTLQSFHTLHQLLSLLNMTRLAQILLDGLLWMPHGVLKIRPADFCPEAPLPLFHGIQPHVCRLDHDSKRLSLLPACGCITHQLFHVCGVRCAARFQVPHCRPKVPAWHLVGRIRASAPTTLFERISNTSLLGNVLHLCPRAQLRPEKASTLELADVLPHAVELTPCFLHFPLGACCSLRKLCQASTLHLA